MAPQVNCKPTVDDQQVTYNQPLCGQQLNAKSMIVALRNKDFCLICNSLKL